MGNAVYCLGDSAGVATLGTGHGYHHGRSGRGNGNGPRNDRETNRMKMISRSRKLAASSAIAVFAVALLAAGALAATSPDQTRETYAAAVEPICKTNTKANEQILSGVRKTIQKGQLSVAAGKFARASSAFGKAVKQIKA